MTQRYLVELYLSQMDATLLRDAARRAHAAAEEMTREGTPVRYLRAIFLGGDEICFHEYQAGSPETVIEASRRAGIPVERIVEAVDVEVEPGS